MDPKNVNKIVFLTVGMLRFICDCHNNTYITNHAGARIAQWYNAELRAG
jgi:hypothetical protein